jgi:general secretion pathway protein E
VSVEPVPGRPLVSSADIAGCVRLSDALTTEYLEEHAVLPIALHPDAVVVGTWRERVDVHALDSLGLLFRRSVSVATVGEEEARSAIRRVYGEETTAESVIAGLVADPRGPAESERALDDLVHQANEAPVVRLVNLLLLEALEARASDVHLEGYAHGLRVRYRVDGVLQDVPAPPAHLMPAVVSRLKIMAELDIAERRVPQDGRIRLRLQDRPVDVRVSTLPTLRGESVVLRLLDKERGGRVALQGLGMADETLAAFAQAVSRPHGIVLATGPTGSGKTTSLYAAVDHIRTGREKILTVEDPVEYELEGVPQVQINERVGVTFPTALRALLRQDPDVLLVGEIRDEETAEIATHAALTGHLVLSTLHTNDAPSALTRLFDLGVAPYLVSSTVEAVLAQRLVRTNCQECGTESTATVSELEWIGAAPTSVQRVVRGRGCAACRGTGYRGRTGIYELLLMNDELRGELHQHRDAGRLRQEAVRKGMRTLRMDGLRLVQEGVTTPEEILRVTRA